MPCIDRIAEPWGTRTPYGPGETWPTRVDQYLADGLRIARFANAELKESAAQVLAS